MAAHYCQRISFVCAIVILALTANQFQRTFRWLCERSRIENGTSKTGFRVKVASTRRDKNTLTHSRTRYASTHFSSHGTSDLELELVAMRARARAHCQLPIDNLFRLLLHSSFFVVFSLRFGPTLESSIAIAAVRRCRCRADFHIFAFHQILAQVMGVRSSSRGFFLFSQSLSGFWLIRWIIAQTHTHTHTHVWLLQNEGETKCMA